MQLQQQYTNNKRKHTVIYACEQLCISLALDSNAFNKYVFNFYFVSFYFLYFYSIRIHINTYVYMQYVQMYILFSMPSSRILTLPLSTFDVGVDYPLSVRRRSLARLSVCPSTHEVSSAPSAASCHHK